MSSVLRTFTPRNISFSPNSLKASLPLIPTDNIGVVHPVIDDEGEVDTAFFLALSDLLDRNAGSFDLALCNQVRVLCLQNGSVVFTVPSSQACRTSELLEMDDSDFPDYFEQLGSQVFTEY